MDGERLGVELRNAARFRNGADVDELRDVMGFQHGHELCEGMRGMPDGQDRERGILFLGPHHEIRITPGRAALRMPERL
jgi:hypothetical protein